MLTGDGASRSGRLEMATKVGRFAKKAKSKWTGSQRKLKRPGHYGKLKGNSLKKEALSEHC